MKALILSDLHINSEYFHHEFGRIKYKRILEDQIKEDYDIVIISGDVVEHRIMNTDVNPFDLLNDLFNGNPIIFCLGNHEFAYENFPDVLKYWKKMEKEYKGTNIHCLDICKFFDVNDYRFVGNVFWYDFSMNHNPLLMKGEIIDGWLDATIKNFDPIKENKKCIKQILKSLDETKKNILVTHMVPHIDLNWFSHDEPTSVYNAYSGNQDFLNQIKDKNVIYSISGHTHKRACKEIYEINCINLGNDYYFNSHKIEHMIIDLD